MKQRILCILLTFCMMLAIIPAVGATASTGTASSIPASSTSAYQYGVIQEIWYDDYTLEDGYVEVEIASEGESDFYLDGISLALFLPATINGTTCSTPEAVAAALPVGSAVRYTMDEINIYDNVWTEGITSITVDIAGNPYYNVTYNPSTGLFSGMTSSTAQLPIVRKDVWTDEGTGETYVDVFPAYLDTYHTYDIEVYEYAVMVTAMWATNYNTTIDYAWLNNNPNGDFLANFELNIQSYAPGCTLHAAVYNAAGTMLKSATAAFSNYEATATFTDLPDESATRTIKAWISSGNSVVSPVYEYTYHQYAYDIVSGTVTQIEDTSNGWSTTARVFLTTPENYTERVWCILPTYVGDTLCETVAQLQAALPVGTDVQVAEGDNCAFQLGAPTPEPDTYGVIANARVARDAWSSEDLIFVRIVLPDYDYGYFDLELSPDLYEDITDLDAYCESLKGSCGKFAFDDTGYYIVAMDVDSTGKTCERRYFPSSGTFENQSDLPIYYLLDGNYEEPILNEDALYTIKVYDYGIVITEMEYVEIDQLIITAGTNIDFTQNIFFNYGIFEEEETDITLHLQLLNVLGDLLEEQSVGNIDVTTNGIVTFRDYPNETSTYHVKAWVTNDADEIISPIYTETDFELTKDGFQTEAQTVYSEIISRVSPTNGVTLTFGSGNSVNFDTKTNINGYTYSTSSDLCSHFKVGMLIEYVDNYHNPKIVRFSERKQQVLTGADYDETKEEVSVTVTLVSNDADTTDTSNVTGTVYAGVYSKAGILKGMTTVPETALSADGTATTKNITIPDIIYEAGDYIKAFFWDANHASISNAATAKIAQ